MSDRPLWRAAIEKVDGLVEPQLIKVAHHENFATATGVLYHLRQALAHEGERLSGAVLHTLNLPTRTDVNRVLSQVASLQREVRHLHDELGPPRDRPDDHHETATP